VCLAVHTKIPPMATPPQQATPSITPNPTSPGDSYVADDQKPSPPGMEPGATETTSDVLSYPTSTITPATSRHRPHHDPLRPHERSRLVPRHGSTGRPACSARAGTRLRWPGFRRGCLVPRAPNPAGRGPESGSRSRPAAWRPNSPLIVRVVGRGGCVGCPCA
jgi:hypothetical protein